MVLFGWVFSALVIIGCSINLNSRDVMNVADFAMNFHNRMSNYPYAFKVVEIVSDEVQLSPPARLKYILDILAVQTFCRNQGNLNLTLCELQPKAETLRCTFSVLAVPGNDHIPKRLLSHHCF
ncbi:hypothetical protein DNTS_005709 [Danionella cerebrum]|uniref:Cystatin domain-containing protein n=1 Tax=Danionella cerebrum TaxID=2873325 RepID=A0A553QSE9_9TELE|nr:hypothetical protein DNTS_005709 [Danionella translucida]